MKRFLIQSFIFLSIAVGLIAIVTVVMDAYIVRKASFKCRADAKYVVLGNSHPEQAYNDSLLDHFQNLAQAAETYLYTFIKAKEIFEQNKQIETVFIEFSNTDLLPEWNKWIWGSAVLSWRYPIYSPFMGMEENKVLLLNNFSGVNNCLPLSLKDNAIRVVHHDLDYSNEMGGFVYNTREKVDSFLEHDNLKENFERVRKNQDHISSYNVVYLTKLVQYLKEKHKRVILIRSPLHRSYPGLGNEAEYEKILHTAFVGVEYLDFNAFPLANADYVDLEHLNFRGARKFSLWFNQLLKEGLLDKENKQQFIEERIKEVRM
ncbi:MAG: hypothetical protein J0H74_01520 [Chitinophagaceae bacterium]|nr:hypothetical protein [Chitinophagaceae bacterium]